MKTKNYSLLFLLILLLLMSSISNGQKLIPLSEDSGKTKTGIKSDICGTDFFHNQKMKTDAGYRKRYQKSVEAIKKTNFKNFKMATQGIRQVPVVVHVMHKGESVGTGTNISDEDVKRGIQYLNNYWRKAIGTPGFGDGADMKIEFALAVQDPNGNCTNGINRVNMSGVPAYVNNGVNVSNTNGLPDYSASGGVNSLKEYGRWDSTKYYNIYLVDEIDNGNCTANMSTSGYAHNAAQHGQPYDGTVILICEYVQETSGVLAHELGHALNLPHTFNGDDANGDGVGDRCGDDNIPDTPRHIRTSSLAVNRDCNSTLANNCDPLFNQIIDPDTGFRRNSGTVQDHMHNYMDYTGCRKEFTGGQRTVATNALTANRASYLTSSALTPKAAATVYFTSSTSNVCIGEPITFYDASSCTPNTYTNTGYNNISFLWTFNNNVNPVITSTLQNPTFTFTNLGTYDVTLTVTNSYGTTSLQKVGMIAVTPGIVAACSMTSVYKGVDGGTGVTNVLFNTLSNRTGTFITDPPLNNFSCSKNTTISVGTAYGLNVTYQSASYAPQFLEVWIDWDNSGTFETLNSNGVNERVLSDNIAAGITKTASASITPPATAALNTLLRMRVISDIYGPPIVCGDGLAQRADDYAVYVNCNPTTPNAISGTVTQCPSVINQVYSVAAVANATSYNWTVPQGWSITTGATTNSITVTIGSAAQSGNISVTAQNTSGTSAARTLAVTVRNAFTAGAINTTGETIVSGGTPTTTIGSATAASGGDGNITYSWRSSADSYTNPISNATLATYLPPAGLTQNTSFRRYAKDNSCNTTPTVATGTWTVTVTAGTIPATPGDISGAVLQCPRATNQVYSIAAVPNATTYNWTVPGGWIISSGAGTTSITVRTGWTLESGNISVTAQNASGTSAARTMYINIRPGTLAKPDVISGSNIQCPSVTSQVYSIAAVANATSYNWTVPQGWQITGGTGTTSITVTTGSAAQNGNISVTAQNTCTTSAARTLAVTVRPAFTSGAINTTGETIIPGGTPTTTIGSATAASGGDGNITYSWRSSADSYTTPISNATLATYLPPAGLTQNTSFRRYAKDNSCNTTPTVATGTWTVMVNSGAKVLKSNAIVPFSVVAYPNPYNETFNLSLTTSSIENVNIEVYDMMGKLLETHQVKPEEVNNLQIGNNVASGIYNVIVSQANEKKTIRLIRK